MKNRVSENTYYMFQGSNLQYFLRNYYELHDCLLIDYTVHMIMCIVQARASLYSSHVVHPLLLLSLLIDQYFTSQIHDHTIVDPKVNEKVSNMQPSTCYHVVSF